jgi:single-strand DNA-binding protein
MAGETIITIIGNLTSDPELRYTQSGLAVASFTIASTPRTFDRNTNDWKDGETLFLRCSAWKELGENVAGSLAKGSRVIAQGALVQRSYETKEGEKRTSIEFQVNDIGAELRNATVSITRTSRSQSTSATSRATEPETWATSGPTNTVASQGQQGSFGADESTPF